MLIKMTDILIMVKAPSRDLEEGHQDGPKALPVNHHSTRRLP